VLKALYEAHAICSQLGISDEHFGTRGSHRRSMEMHLVRYVCPLASNLKCVIQSFAEFLMIISLCLLLPTGV